MFTWYVAAFFTLAGNAGNAVFHSSGGAACAVDPDNTYAVQVSTPVNGKMRIVQVPCKAENKMVTVKNPDLTIVGLVPSE